MKIVADLHLHSKYSRAVSLQMDLENMVKWAKIKGIDLLGTADFTHPMWFRELQTKLKQKSPGIYQLKEDKSSDKISFVLTTEISSIYSQDNKARRIHNILIAPSLQVVEKINKKLQNKGANLMSDGRPIIRLSSQQLCELVWSIDKNILVIPAHVWTPWYSLYGSKSGFDSIEECYGRFANWIYAIETGLSSDPAMNWQIKELDNRSIVSFSDAHSPAKLGREATVFEFNNQQSANYSFNDLIAAIKQKNGSNLKIDYTIEFYPQEGKYHYTGHRTCQISQSPEETEKKGGLCPVCSKPLTIGVMHRVKELSQEKKIKSLKKETQNGLIGYYNADNPKKPSYVMLVPLAEIIAEAAGIGSNTKKVKGIFEKLTSKWTEFDILTRINTGQISSISGEKIAEGIKKVRQGDIFIKPGFDGTFGIVKIWADNQEKSTLEKEQMSLF